MSQSWENGVTDGRTELNAQVLVANSHEKVTSFRLLNSKLQKKPRCNNWLSDIG